MSETASQRSAREQQVDAIIAEYYEAADLGKAPNQAQFLAVHSEFADELQAFFEDVGRLKEVARPFEADLSATQAPVGFMIRDYRIMEQIGKGGMGTVYRALHTRLDKTVALKIIRADHKRNRDAISRFEREMRAVGKLEHEHIVHALDAGEEQGLHFLVMEYIAGINLSHLVRELEHLSLAEACELTRQAALGLHHAHENNIVHRDVKPSNLMLSRQGQVKVLDLGLAQFQKPILEDSTGLTRDGDLIGTLLYMAPEQLAHGGQVDARTDVYCLGVTLCELLVGDLPRKQGFDVPLLTYLDRRRADLPPPVLGLLNSMLSHSRSDRPRSMAEVARQLQPYARGGDPRHLLERLFPSSPAMASAMSRTERARANVSQDAPPPESLVGTGVVSDSATVPEPPPAPPIPPPLPPPIAAAATTRPFAALDGPWKWLALWAAVVAMFALGLGVVFWQLGPTSESGMVTLEGEEPILGEVLMGPGIWAIPKDSRDNENRIRLNAGQNKLPAGEYRLFSRAWMLAFSVQGQSDVSTFTVRPNSPLFVRAAAHTDFPWQLPEIPTASGAFAESYGKLQRGITGKEVSYNLRLTVLNEVDVAGVPHRWLEVVVATRTQGQYVERGYLLVDPALYRRERKLKVARGWIEAEMPAIQAQLALRFPGVKPAALVVAFNPKKDSLAELAQQLELPLPSDRVSVQEAMALLFEADFTGGLSPGVSFLRQQLAAKRKLHYESVTGTLRAEDCLVIRSEIYLEGDAPAKPSVKYELDRAQDVPFNFVYIDVQTPLFRGDFHLKDYKSLPDATSPLRTVDETRLKVAATIFGGALLPMAPPPIVKPVEGANLKPTFPKTPEEAAVVELKNPAAPPSPGGNSVPSGSRIEETWRAVGRGLRAMQGRETAKPK